VNDALAISFLDVTIASGFVAHSSEAQRLIGRYWRRI